MSAPVIELRRRAPIRCPTTSWCARCSASRFERGEYVAIMGSSAPARTLMHIAGCLDAADRRQLHNRRRRRARHRRRRAYRTCATARSGSSSGLQPGFRTTALANVMPLTCAGLPRGERRARDHALRGSGMTVHDPPASGLSGGRGGASRRPRDRHRPSLVLARGRPETSTRTPPTGARAFGEAQARAGPWC